MANKSIYNTELWIGELREGGYNYEVRGVPEDAFGAKVIICQEMIERLKQITDFYKSIVAKKLAERKVSNG